jgi:hypothetical protein
MTDQKTQPGSEHGTPCMNCGQPTSRGNHFCRECIDAGIGPCEVCEGGAIEEDEQ